MISLQDLRSACDELEWVAERGARVVYLSTAPASGFGGRRSIAQREFDPFWTLMEDTGIVAGFHQVVNRRYPVDVAELDGTGETGRYFVPPGFGLSFHQDLSFRALCTPRWQVADFIASLIGHGCLARHPRLKVAIVEFGTDYVRPMVHHFQDTYERTPVLFDEDPMVTLRRNVFIHAFSEPDPLGLIELLGVENTMWGSDFPHPEGMRDPLAFSEEIESLPLDARKAVMGGNLERLLGD